MARKPYIKDGDIVLECKVTNTDYMAVEGEFDNNDLLGFSVVLGKDDRETIICLDIGQVGKLIRQLEGAIALYNERP